MFGQEKISTRQLYFLAVLFVIGDGIWYSPSIAVTEARQDAWISTAVALGIGLLLVAFYNALSTLYRGETFAQFTERVLGRWVGVAASLLFFGYALTVTSTVLRTLAGFLITVVLPRTPIHFIDLTFMAVVIMGAYLGIEVVARAAEIFFPYALFFIILILFLLLPQIEVEKIQPVFEAGFNTVLRGTVPMLANPYFELGVFLVLLPYINQTKSSSKAFLIATLIGGSLYVVLTALSIFVIGVDLTERQVFPIYTLAKKISIGHFLERLEVLLSGSIFFAMFFKLVLSFYASAVGLAHTLRLQDYKPLLFPLGMIVIVYSIIMYPNITYALYFTARIYPYFTATFGLLLPAVLFAAAIWRRKRG